MFRRKTDTPSAPTPTTTVSRVTSVLGPETNWKGQLGGSGGVRVEGTFELRRENAVPFATVTSALGTESPLGTSAVVHTGTNTVSRVLGSSFTQSSARLDERTS